MLYPKSHMPFDRAVFAEPGAEYRCAPFWAWNCQLDNAHLCSQIEAMKQMGMGGFFMHPRLGLKTEYLSDAFMDSVRVCTEKAVSEGMLAYLYDEDKWPSGYAGGLNTKNPENRQKYVRMSTAEQSRGRLLAKFDVLLDAQGYLAGYRLLKDGEPAQGTVWHAFFEVMEDRTEFNYQAYADLLRKEAIDDFIAITHERYKATVGSRFGTAVPAIFTDEPQLQGKNVLNSSGDKNDVFLPFTTDMEDTYKEIYGESLIEKLPEIIWEQKDRVAVTRYQYMDHTAERFTQAFCDNIGTWCRENGILLTGHMMNEPTLDSQTFSMGEAMRGYRSMGLPGVDMLCDLREWNTVKQAASAVHQYGREGLTSELYGVTNWDFDFRGHKLQGDWQAALGVTLRVPHLYWASMKGDAKRDYPASIGDQSAWYREYGYIEDHFARVNALMTRGKPEVQVAVIHPIESYWLHYGPKDLTGDLRQQMDRDFAQLTDWLLQGTVDFDFVCESLLPEQFRETEQGFQVGEMNYGTVVVAGCETLRGTTVEALEKFVGHGGQVIFVGQLPTMVGLKPSERIGALALRSKVIERSRLAVLSALEPYRDLEIRTADGIRAEGLVYGLRRDGDCKNLFIAHGEDCRRDCVGSEERYVIRIAGEFVPRVMDTMTGESYILPARYPGGDTVIDWECASQSSLLLRLEPGRSQWALGETRRTVSEDYVYLPEPCAVELSEPNVLVLDQAQWRTDDGPWQEQQYMLRIECFAKLGLNFSTRYTWGAQPWAYGDIPFEHTISCRFSFTSRVEVENAYLATEDLDCAEIWFNGEKLPMTDAGHYVDRAIRKTPCGTIRKGVNTVLLTKPFNLASKCENIQILGDFGVECVGRQAVITEPVRTLRFDDWTKQGLAFYGGAVTYRFRLRGGNYAMQLGLYAAPCVTVRVDGKEENVSLAPYLTQLRIPEGEHTVEIRVFASRANTFGALHNVNGADSWYGPGYWGSWAKDFSYGYRLKPTGLLSAPILYTLPTEEVLTGGYVSFGKSATDFTKYCLYKRDFSDAGI